MILFTVAYAFRISDRAVILENYEETGSLPEFEEYCRKSGSIQIFLESVAYVNLVIYIWLLRYSARHPTANMAKLRIQTYILILLISSCVWAFIFFGTGVGVETSLTCGVKFDAYLTEYTELFRNWPILLVPYLLYRSFTLTQNLPGFIEQSFSYYALQVITYVLFFSGRMVLSFILQFTSVTLYVKHGNQANMSNIMIGVFEFSLHSCELGILMAIISMD